MRFRFPYCLPLAFSAKDIARCKRLVMNGVDKYVICDVTEEFEVVAKVYDSRICRYVGWSVAELYGNGELA